MVLISLNKWLEQPLGGGTRVLRVMLHLSTRWQHCTGYWYIHCWLLLHGRRPCKHLEGSNIVNFGLLSVLICISSRMLFIYKALMLITRSLRLSVSHCSDIFWPKITKCRHWDEPLDKTADTVRLSSAGWGVWTTETVPHTHICAFILGLLKMVCLRYEKRISLTATSATGLDISSCSANWDKDHDE